MNLFLKNGRLHTKNSSNNSAIPKIKSKFKINTPSKKTINHRNKLSLFNPKEKRNNLFLKMPNESLKKYELTQTEYTNNKKNFDKILSKTFETKNNNLSYHTIKIEEDNLYKNRSNKLLYKVNKDDSDNNKMLISLKKRNSVFVKEPQNLNKIYGLAALPSTPRIHHLNSLNENMASPVTFFTTIPIENNNTKKYNSKEIENSKKNSLNSFSKIFQKLKIKKNYYEMLKLKELKNQIHKFEMSEKFQPNEKLIEKYLSSPDKFINKKYEKSLNLKNLKINLKDMPKYDNKKILYTIPHKKSNKSNPLYEAINNLQKDSEINKNNVINSKYDYNYEKTDKILKNALKRINLMNDEVTEYLKDVAIDYKKEIGDFTFYRGKGIYSNHLATLKKDENLLAFMLTNELVE